MNHKEPQRYSVLATYADGYAKNGMEKRNNGEWVRYEDAKKWADERAAYARNVALKERFLSAQDSKTEYIPPMPESVSERRCGTCANYESNILGCIPIDKRFKKLDRLPTDGTDCDGWKPK